MQAAVFYDVDDIRVEEMAPPVCGPQDILVATRACGICSGELMGWYMKSKAPFVFGHEPCGVVAEVGAHVEEFKVGDRVFVHHHAPCFTCRACRRGAFVMCETWKRSRIEPGGMAELFRVPRVNQRDTLPLPAAVGWDGGILVEPLACVLQALTRARIEPGDTVLVIGLGIMGQLLSKAAWSFGAGMVMGADFVASRRDTALRLGAERVFDPAIAPLHRQVQEALGGGLADAVLVGPPLVQAMQDGLDCAGPGGTVVFFSPAPPGERLEIDPHRIYFQDISLVPSYSCGPRDTRRAMGMLAGGAVQPKDLISRTLPLAEVAQGYEAMRRGGDVIKVMIEFDFLKAGEES